MTDEITICAAALFRNKGKNVMTIKEYTMYISLDLRWMPVKEAKRLLDLFISREIVTMSDEYIRAIDELNDVDVPVAYRPSDDFLSFLEMTSEEEQETATVEEMFPKLLALTDSIGLKKGEFIAQCNGLVKKLNIDMTVAALIILRDNGTDISPYLDGVYSEIQHK